MKFIAVFLLTLCCFNLSLSAQKFFKGFVADAESHKPLAGATITITQHPFTSSNANGEFELNGINGNTVELHISFVGYINKDSVFTLPQRNNADTVFLFPAVAQEEDVTVSSVRTNSRIENIPTRVEVIGKEDLEEENGIKPGNIASILGDIAGVQMQQVSASSGNTYARIEGLNGRYTQILKDGLPLFGGLSQNFSVMQIPPLDLKQIEIIKGSASTLYGGDAIGGIINLVSKIPAEKPALSFTANQTTLNETNLNGYYAQRFKTVGLSFFAAQTFQKQNDIDKDGLSDVPNVHSTVIHPKFIFYFNHKSTLTLSYTGTFDRREGGSMQYFSDKQNDSLYFVNNQMQRHNANANWQYNFSQNSNLSVKFSSSFLTQNTATKYYLFNAGQTIYYSEISYLYKSAKADFVAGLNFNGDIFKNKTPAITALDNYNYATIGAFAQATWRPLNKLTIEAGIREDHHSDYKFFPLPRLSFMYKFSNAVTARINGGLGYKIPVIINYVDPETDLNKITVSKKPDAELSQGINADINFNKKTGAVALVINQSFFYTNISHPVYDSSTNVDHVYLLNANKSLQTTGSQTYARLNFENMELYLAYVYTDVRQRYNMLHPHPYITPRNNFAATFLYEFSNHFKAGIESSVIAAQLDENYKPVKNYTLIALMFNYTINHWSFVLNGENLLDFRQNKYGKIYDGTINNPIFHKLWAPIDGRVINFSVRWSL